MFKPKLWVVNVAERLRINAARVKPIFTSSDRSRRIIQS